MLDPKLLEILACPKCRGPVVPDDKHAWLLLQRLRRALPRRRRHPHHAAGRGPEDPGPGVERMCLFTHFAAGALAGGATGNVWVGAAAGLASHAVLDMIPHWDHPDWRFELAAGLASLALLLLTPFATAPAIVGGIMGMVPDLENLFQKLGWMGRGRFVFPTHTGLLPHGRSLGPRSVVWQVAIFVVCFGALGLIIADGGDGRRTGRRRRAGPARSAGPVRRRAAHGGAPAAAGAAGAGRLGRPRSAPGRVAGRRLDRRERRRGRAAPVAAAAGGAHPRGRAGPGAGRQLVEGAHRRRLRSGRPGAGGAAGGAAGRAHRGRDRVPVRRRRRAAPTDRRIQPPAHRPRARKPGSGPERRLRPEGRRGAADRRAQSRTLHPPGRRRPRAGSGQRAAPRTRTPPAPCSPPPATG